jgi:hypothetical protein
MKPSIIAYHPCAFSPCHQGVQLLVISITKVVFSGWLTLLTKCLFDIVDLFFSERLIRLRLNHTLCSDHSWFTCSSNSWIQFITSSLWTTSALFIGNSLMILPQLCLAYTCLLGCQPVLNFTRSLGGMFFIPKSAWLSYNCANWALIFFHLEPLIVSEASPTYWEPQRVAIINSRWSGQNRLIILSYWRFSGG